MTAGLFLCDGRLSEEDLHRSILLFCHHEGTHLPFAGQVPFHDAQHVLGIITAAGDTDIDRILEHIITGMEQIFTKLHIRLPLTGRARRQIKKDKGIKRLRKYFKKQLRLPTPLTEIGINDTRFAEMAQKTIAWKGAKDGLLHGFVSLSAKDLEEIYRLAL